MTNSKIKTSPNYKLSFLMSHGNKERRGSACLLAAWLEHLSRSSELGFLLRPVESDRI